MGGLYNQPQSKAEVDKLCHNDTIHYRQTKYNPYLLVKKGWCLIHLVNSHKERHDKNWVDTDLAMRPLFYQI